MRIAEKQYILNRDTRKIELSFSKDEYKALPEADKAELKRYFNFSRYASAWVSKSTNNHYSAIRIAEKLGFINGGKVGERLSFAEEMERQAERAEARAERYEQYADNAEHRAKKLQSEFNELSKDWSWVTQPNVNTSAGRRFTNQRKKVYERYNKGFEEYRKSEYFKERAETARITAYQTQLKSKSYLNNRIEECNKIIRDYERSIVRAEEQNNEKWLENLLEKMEYEIDKLAYFQNCLDEIGGIQYNKDNIKAGYLVKIRGTWDLVVKTNSKTLEVKPSVVPYTLRYPYAEITDVKIPEGWTEQKNEIKNPFQVNDILVRKIWNNIMEAYQVVKVTSKMVVVQQIQVENNHPVKDAFIRKQERKGVKKDRDGIFVVNHGDYYLYLFKNEEVA